MKNYIRFGLIGFAVAFGAGLGTFSSRVAIAFFQKLAESKNEIESESE